MQVGDLDGGRWEAHEQAARVGHHAGAHDRDTEVRGGAVHGDPQEFLDHGGKKDRGSAPYHARNGSRSVLREIVHQLEKSGLLQPYKTKGRRVSPEGAKLLDSVSRDVLKSLAADRPELAKYL